MKEIILDTETTGLSVKDGHRIVEIGCLELNDLIPTKKTFHCYLNPERKVSEKALEVHGYTDEFLSDKKKFSEIVDEFLSFIKDKRLIIHNAEFDLSHLNNELKLFGKKKIENQVVDTLILARAVGNKGTVIAFEPKEGRFEILKNNIKLNGYDNVIVENKAIMLDGQEKKFFVHDDNTAGYRFITNRSDDNLTKKFSKPVDVLTTDLDAYLTDLGIIDKISFMKIDVDGPELLVLQSGRQLLKNQNLNILLEWDQDAAKWSNCSPESIIDILLENGFEIYYPDYIKKKYFHITKERLLNIDPLDDVINILCVKDKSILEDNELLT